MFETNLSIPGLMSQAELEKLSELASNVPENGIIVEVGSLYGLSAWHLARHSKESVTVFCIDPWVRTKRIVDEVEIPRDFPEFSQELFVGYTQEFSHKIRMIQGYSPDDVSDWDQPIDMFFEDASHKSTDDISRDCDFWSNLVRNGGIVSGHDYAPRYPDVIEISNKLANRYQATLQTTETLWYFTRASV